LIATFDGDCVPVVGKQQFMVLHQNKLYIYNKETDTRAQKILTLANFCK